MSQATSGSQPLYVTAGRNGRNTISIDSAGRSLTNSTTQTIGFFAVAIAPAGTQSFGSLLSFGDKHGLIRNGTGENLYFASPPTSAMFGDSSVYRRNGSASTVLGTSWAVFSAGGSADTRAVRLSTDSIGGTAATGEFGELLAYSANVTAAQRQAIERYLAGKWGISLA